MSCMQLRATWESYQIIYQNYCTREQHLKEAGKFEIEFMRSNIAMTKEKGVRREIMHQETGVKTKMASIIYR